MILVSGATGTVGSILVQLLTAQGEEVRAMTRDPDRAQVPAGVHAVRADFADPGALAAATRGATALFLLAPPGPAQPRHDLALLAAAADAGVPTVVKLSAIGTGLASHPRVGQWHQPGEDALRAGDAAWTILRPTTFASNMLFFADTIRRGEPVPNPFGTGAQAVVDPADVAAVAAAVLTSTVHSGQTYTLTGPELLTLPDQVAIIAAASGRSAATVDLPAEEWHSQLLASGADPGYAGNVVEGARFVQAGHNAVRTGEVARILGRPAASFSAWAAAHREAFA